MSIYQHAIGTDYDDDTPVLIAALPEARPVANPRQIMHTLETLHPEIKDRYFMMDVLRYDDFYAQFYHDDTARQKIFPYIAGEVTYAPNHYSFHLNKHLEARDAFSLEIPGRSNQPSIHVINPIQITDSVLSNSYPFCDGLLKLSDSEYIGESILTAAHEVGHILEAERGLADLIQQSCCPHQHFLPTPYRRMASVGSELYADQIAATTGPKIQGLDFAEAALVFLDSRVLSLFETLKSSETPSFNYATHLVWHHALAGTANPDSTRAAIAANPQMEGAQDALSAFGHTQDLTKPDDVIGWIHQRIDHTTTAFAWTLGQNMLDAFERRLPENSFDPDLMHKTKRHVYECTSGQKFAAAYPAPSALAARHHLADYRRRATPKGMAPNIPPTPGGRL